MRTTALIISLSVALSGWVSTESRADSRASTGTASPLPRTEPLSLSAQQMSRDLSEYLRRWEAQEEHLGERKRQRLEVARYHLATENDDLFFDHDPAAREETEDILRSVALKLLRENVKESPAINSLLRPLESSGDRLKAKSSGWSLRVSPRFGFGDNPDLGANFSVRHGRILSRFTLGFRDRPERDETAVFLHYEDRSRYFRLNQSLDGNGRQVWTLTLRWQF